MVSCKKPDPTYIPGGYLGSDIPVASSDPCIVECISVRYGQLAEAVCNQSDLLTMRASLHLQTSPGSVRLLEWFLALDWLTRGLVVPIQPRRKRLHVCMGWRYRVDPHQEGTARQRVRLHCRMLVSCGGQASGWPSVPK